MRSIVLTILATVSIVLLAVLLGGYFVDGSVNLVRDSYVGGTVKIGGVTVRSQRGGVELLCMSYVVPSLGGSGVHWYLSKQFYAPSSIGLPRLRNCLWNFAIGSNSAAPKQRTWVVDCPNWLPILVCAIAPILWWRRKRDRVARGFEVAHVSPSPRSTQERD
jgi:hypothetical protein